MVEVFTAAGEAMEGLRWCALHVVEVFTAAGEAMEGLRWCALHGVHAVVGTTGFTEGRGDRASGAVRGGPTWHGDHGKEETLGVAVGS